MKVIGRNWITKEQIEYPDILYKYRNWHNANYPFHDNVLLNNEMYIPSPNEFEDIKDCRNPTRYDKLSDEELVRVCEIRLRDMHPKFNDKAIRNMAIERSKDPSLRDVEWLAQHEEEWFRKECEFRGILSVTGNPLRPEMWQKYSGNSTGICYGFDPFMLVEDLGVGSGGIVNYVDLPEISPFDDLATQIFKRIYCKEPEWGFEEEYRLGRFESFDRVQHFRNETLREVILGESFPDESMGEVIDLLRDKGSVSQLFKCIRQDGQLNKDTIAY